ncbi:MAG: hypothetical protein KA714_30635 [Limnoraphis sp. WC205]|jgi:hypothetical protein|nr:hypothetical protein [Limnoraphis sp. WC205]
MKNLENLPIEKRIKLMEAAKRLNQTCHEIKEESGRDTTFNNRQEQQIVQHITELKSQV